MLIGSFKSVFARAPSQMWIKIFARTRGAFLQNEKKGKTKGKRERKTPQHR